MVLGVAPKNIPKRPKRILKIKKRLGPGTILFEVAPKNMAKWLKLLTTGTNGLDGLVKFLATEHKVLGAAPENISKGPKHIVKRAEHLGWSG